MPDPSSLTILLVEDDDGHAMLVERNLRRAGVINRLDRVADGQAALDFLWRRGAYSGRPPGQQLLVLLDIRLPLVDGVEVLRQMKADEQLRRMPVIMLTTTDDPREIQRCYDLGCNAYVVKPVDYERFIAVTRQLGLFLAIVQVPPEQEGGER